MNIGRRSLITGVAGAYLAAVPGVCARASTSRLGPIGIQLFSVRDLFVKDPHATLQKIAEVGYKEIEFGGGGFEKLDPVQLRRTMDRVGLTAPAAHVSYVMLTDQFDATIKMAKTLGLSALVLPGLFDEQRVEPAITELLQNLNRIGARLKPHGMQLVYHNHDFEFTQRTGDKVLFDRFVEETDPRLLAFELDIYWALYAGVDVNKLINRLGPRLYAYHVKDMLKDRSMGPVGSGTIDFAELFRLPGSKHVRHFFVENDEAPPPYIPDITMSIENLRKLTF